MNLCSGSATHIGRTILTVTATEDSANAAAVDDDPVVLRGRLIAAAEYIMDGVPVTVVYMHLGGAIAIKGGVRRLVSAAIDSLEGISLRQGTARLVLRQQVGTIKLIVGSSQRHKGILVREDIGTTMGSAVDMHLGVAIGRAGDVVGTIDTAMDGGAACRSGGWGNRGCTDIDISVALSGRLLITHRGHLAAAVDIKHHLAIGDIDGGLAEDTAREDLGRSQSRRVTIGTRLVGHGVVEMFLVVAAAVAAAIDGTEIIGCRACADSGADGAAVDIDDGVLSHRSHLATAIDITLDGAASDGQRGGLHTAHGRPTGILATIQQDDTAHRAGKDIAALGVQQLLVGIELGEAQGASGLVDKGIVRVVDILVAIADKAAGDIDGDMAMGIHAIVGLHGSIAWVGCRGVGQVDRHQPGAHGGQTTTAIDGAQHGATLNIDIDVARHDACREGLAAETAATTEDVTVDIGGAEGANQGSLLASGNRRIVGCHSVIVGCRSDVHLSIAQHMAILGAAEDRAVDPAARDVDLGAGDVSPGVEEDALVTLAAAKEVAGNRMISNLVEGARHAQGGAAAEVHSAAALDVGVLVAAIDGGEDMTARDSDGGVALDDTCRLKPLAGSRGGAAGAAAEDVTVESVAVLAGSGGIVRVIARLVSIGVVG